MNFIRNIISEKRAARPMAPPLAEPRVEGRPHDIAKAENVEATFAAVAAAVAVAAAPGASPAEPDFRAAHLNAVDADMKDADFEDDEPPLVTELTFAPEVRAAEPGAAAVAIAAASEVDEGAPLATKSELREVPVADGLLAPLRLTTPVAADLLAPLRLTTPVEPEELAAYQQPANQRDLTDMPFISVQPEEAPGEVVSDAAIQMPPPALGRGSSRAGRVKTRLLGFNADGMGLANPFEREESRASDAFPVGWLVVVAGPGAGASFALHDGVAKIGRGEDQTVPLAFGDNSISRENHLSIAFDPEQSAFYIGQSGRSNIVRLNNKPLLSTEQVRSGDQIRVGETTLRLVALCGEDFNWSAKG